jgi:hypothetical protein
MDQAGIERHLAGVIINGEKYNVVIAEAYEHMKSNSELVTFLKDDAVGYQAYLALRDTDWVTHTGETHMFGWINCSALVSLLRDKGEHPQHMWWGEHEGHNPAAPDPETFAKFDELLIKSGWSVKHRSLISELYESPDNGM